MAAIWLVWFWGTAGCVLWGCWFWGLGRGFLTDGKKHGWVFDRCSLKDFITVDNHIVEGYYLLMIRGFKDKETEKVFHGRFSRKLPQDIQRIAERKLIMLHRAANLHDLQVPPSNRLEALKGNRRGQHSIRINDQWRICFRWQEDGVYDVEIVDYH
jgi:proteic killer suppression protein